MLFKKTLMKGEATSRQALALVSKVIAGLSAASIISEAAQFHIDSPAVTNQRCKIFNQGPILVYLAGHIGGPTAYVGAHIETHWNPLLDLVIIQRQILSEVPALFTIHHSVDVVVCDSSVLDLVLRSIKVFKGPTDYEPKLILCVGTDVNIKSHHKGVVFNCNESEALKTLLNWRLEQLRVAAMKNF